MPIKPENRSRYPRDWRSVSKAVRERAGNACEGSPDFPDCRAENGKPHPVTGSKVVLTVAHLDHTPENCSPENLRAWCQRCHLNYDRKNTKTRKEKRQMNDAKFVLEIDNKKEIDTFLTAHARVRKHNVQAVMTPVPAGTVNPDGSDQKGVVIGHYQCECGMMAPVKWRAVPFNTDKAPTETEVLRGQVRVLKAALEQIVGVTEHTDLNSMRELFKEGGVMEHFSGQDHTPCRAAIDALLSLCGPADQAPGEPQEPYIEEQEPLAHARALGHAGA